MTNGHSQMTALSCALQEHCPLTQQASEPVPATYLTEDEVQMMAEEIQRTE